MLHTLLPIALLLPAQGVTPPTPFDEEKLEAQQEAPQPESAVPS
jgi:hypothetical protein